MLSHNLVEYAGGRTQALVYTLGGGLPLDRDTFELRVDGHLVDGIPVENGNTVTWYLGRILDNGARNIAFFARNAKGASLSSETTVTVSRAPAFITVHQYPEAPVRASGIEYLFEVYVTDRFGLPVADGTPVTVNGNLLTVPTVSGTARCYFLEDTLPAQLTIRAGEIAERVTPRFGNETYRTVRLHDVQTSQPVAGVTAFSEGQILGTSNSEGWLPIPAQTRNLSVRRNGFDDITVALNGGHAVVGLIPTAGGTLHGKTIMLDAACGGSNAGATGPTGMRASDAALDVVRRVANRLRDRGAHVVLAREDDNDPPALERVRPVLDAAGWGPRGGGVRNGFGHGQDGRPARSAHRKERSSPRITPEARAASAWRRPSQTPCGLPVTTSVTYTLQQTACPAVWCSRNPSKMRAEHLLLQPETRRPAEALAGAIEGYFRAGSGE